MNQTNTNYKLKKELDQPVSDLIARIEKNDVYQILEVCYNSVTSTRQLKTRWPQASIVVFDGSRSLYAKVETETDELNWTKTELLSLGTFDLIFSSSAFQYLPSHKSLLNNLYALLSATGVLAIQTPNAANMPINLIVESVASGKKWKAYFKEPIFTHYYSPKYYYEILSDLKTEISLWEINYYHSATHYQEIIDLYAITGMKPYLDKLSGDNTKTDFANDILQLLPAEYKQLVNQSILFPFRRTFFITNKK